MKKFWNFKNESGASEAELLLYQPISSESWYQNEKTPQVFASELAALGGKDVLVRINSNGGDVFAANAIYNMLKDYKGKVKCKVDGIAASAATIVMVAAEQVEMPKNALIMIHNPACELYGSYMGDELKKLAEALDKVKFTIRSAYESKVGDKCEPETLDALMDNETWLTAAEAVDYGLADMVLDASVPMVKNGNVFFVNQVAFDKLPNAASLPKNVFKEKNTTKPQEEKDMFKNLDEMRAAYPDLCREMEAAAAQNALNAEKTRISDLDALDVAGNTVVNGIIAKAKTNGQTAEAIKDFVEVAAGANATPVPKDKGAAFVNGLINGTNNSGGEGVGSEPKDAAANINNEKAAAITNIMNVLK